MNKATSTSYDLVGGSPQGSLLGQLLYIIGSDDVAQDVPEEDQFKYVDDLATLDTVFIKEKLMTYNVWEHVPSDIAIDESFLPSSTFKSQTINNQVSEWTIENKMKINVDKSKYMVFSKSREKFATRLTIDSAKVDRAREMIHLGVWISDDNTWDKHISEMCKRAYPRIKMITKLKYVGVTIEDLIELYILMIRSITEYCSTVFHSSLTQKLNNKIEAIQKASLRVILGVMYVNYEAALEMCGLLTLHERRERRSLQFALKCTKHPVNKNIFPLNSTLDQHEVRNREVFRVNKSHTQTYKNSAIPQLQRRLNNFFLKHNDN